MSLVVEEMHDQAIKAPVSGGSFHACVIVDRSVSLSFIVTLLDSCQQNKESRTHPAPERLRAQGGDRI